MKKIAAILLVLMFVAFAAVQYNDPDPWLWMPVYLIYAGIALSAATRPLNSMWYVFAFAVPLIFALFQWPEQWEGLGETMMNENTERARESLGLLICSVSSLIAKKLGN